MTNPEPSNEQIEAINEVLFKLDPMHTGSVENDLYDEYYRIAEGIAESIEQGMPLDEAIQRELEFWFGEDDYSAKVMSIRGALNNIEIK